jgi:CRISPR type I-E-associated protein CasB/Cse2
VPDTTETSSRSPLLRQLYSLAGLDGGKPDRQALARLRRAGTGEPKALLGAYPYVIPVTGTRSIDDSILLASLFASHPERGKARLGRALRIVMRERNSQSVELRFLSLLQASREDLDQHLRHAIALCRSAGVPLDWEDLEWVIRRWKDPEHTRQKRLAFDFWNTTVTEDDADGRTETVS